MKCYFKVDKLGEIIGSEMFEETDKVPSNYKKSWPPEEILINPFWDFKHNNWVERVEKKEVSEVRGSKREELNLACESHILNGFDYKIKDTIYHFSYDREAQLNLQETFQMFQNDMLESIIWTVKLKGEHTRITLTRDIFNKIYTKSLQHKHDAISRLRDVLNPILEQLHSVEQIEALKWDSQVNFPLDPSVNLKEDNTIDVQIDGVNKKTENLAMENEMLTMAILEVANSAMGGGK